MADTKVSTEMKESIVNQVIQDPGLPRPSPSIAFWQEPPHPISSVQSPLLPEQVDYAIIGSGITGCSVAHTLLNHANLTDKRVAVFEARGLTSGATGRNGGHLVSPASVDFSMMSEAFGVEKAAEVARFSYRSVDRVYELVSTLDQGLQDAAEVRKVLTVTNLWDETSFTHCREAVRQFKEACPDLAEEVTLLTGEEAKEKYDFAESSGAVEHSAGALWPYRLITGILAQLLEQHASRFTIDTHTPVTKITYDADLSPYPYRLDTPRGPVAAAQVIHCTNGFTGHLLPALRGKIFPLRGTMSTQSLSPEAPNRGGKYSWSMSHDAAFDPETGVMAVGLYYLTQNEKTGDFFLGGEKQRYDQVLVSDDTVVPSVPAENLTTLMTKIFRHPSGEEYTSTPKRIWSGIMGFTPDWMPLVGPLGSKWSGNPGEGEWIAAGFNGHGMDKCWLIGETLAGMIAGDDMAGKLPRAFEATDTRLEALLADEVPASLFRL